MEWGGVGRGGNDESHIVKEKSHHHIESYLEGSLCFETSL